MKLFATFLLLSGSIAAVAQSEAYFRAPVADRAMAGLSAGEATLVQTGQLNQLHYQATGRSNIVNLSQQGTANALDLTITGTNNRYSFAQQGDNNVARWQSRQSNAQLDVLQRGDNNQLIQTGNGRAAGVPLRIEQTGGMQLQIQTGF
ncbi:hypothetical protein [uncultured Fibrella sp.]|uniref:hypothetical protein n=1 Tax=uncultured Fibrella sp. TaxID=1284596 RepID=UPI0035CA43FF